MLKHQSLAGSDNLQHHKHAASVVESARHCDFCCGVVEVKAAQLVNVRKQILAAGKVILQFLHSKAAEPATENEKKQREVCSALHHRHASQNQYAERNQTHIPTSRANVTVRVIPGPPLPSVLVKNITLVTKLRKCTSASSLSPYRSRKYSWAILHSHFQ